MLRTVHKYQTLAFFEGLTSSDVLIFIVKVNLSVLYQAVYLSRSIRPNKYPKTECQIWCKARPSPSLSFLLLRGKFKQVYATWHCVIRICAFPLSRIPKRKDFFHWNSLSCAILLRPSAEKSNGDWRKNLGTRAWKLILRKWFVNLQKGVELI